MLRVLLADDEYLEREALKIILNEGIEDAVIVGEAQTGKTAVELFQAHQPNLIFMDIKMPVMDGLDATEIIKKQNQDTIIIILSAYESFQYAQKALRLGADDYILKPARPEDIIAAVKKQMNMQKMVVERSVVLDNLLHYIHKENYKEARKELKQILMQLSSQYGEQPEKLVDNSHEVASKMIFIAEQQGIMIKDTFAAALEDMNRFTIEEVLFKILDHIFEAIINGSSMDENSSIQGVLNYIEKNFQKGITLEEVAEYAHLSPYYLSKLFKKEQAVNFVNYVMERRIELAKELLANTDMPILNIALELSYNEPNYFSKVFKKIAGKTPTEYREMKLREREAQSGLNDKYKQTGNENWYI